MYIYEQKRDDSNERLNGPIVSSHYFFLKIQRNRLERRKFHLPFQMFKSFLCELSNDLNGPVYRKKSFEKEKESNCPFVSDNPLNTTKAPTEWFESFYSQFPLKNANESFEKEEESIGHRTISVTFLFLDFPSKIRKKLNGKAKELNCPYKWYTLINDDHWTFSLQKFKKNFPTFQVEQRVDLALKIPKNFQCQKRTTCMFDFTGIFLQKIEIVNHRYRIV